MKQFWRPLGNCQTTRHNSIIIMFRTLPHPLLQAILLLHLSHLIKILVYWRFHMKFPPENWRSRSATESPAGSTTPWRTSAGSSCRWSWSRSSRTIGWRNNSRKILRKTNRRNLLSAFRAEIICCSCFTLTMKLCY